MIVAGVLLMAITAAEAALVHLSRGRVRALAGRPDRRAAALTRYIERRSALYAVLRFGRTLTLIAGSAAATVIAVDRAGADRTAIMLTAVAVVIVAGLLQDLPDFTVRRAPERWALGLSPLMRLLEPLLRVPMWVFNLPGSILSRLAPHPPAPLEEEQQELLRLVEMEESNGGIEREERQMIRGVIKLVDTTAREIMVPRIDMAAVECAATMADVERIIVDRGFSRIPLFEDSVDNIVGVIYAKDVLKHLAEGSHPDSLKTLARPPYFIPETKKVDELLTELRQNKIHIAIVVDEYGGTAGLVTTEDILEEIVGEIEDEYDMEEAIVERVSETEAVLDARVGIDALNEMFHVDIGSEDYDTVGGIIFTELGRVPVVGDEVRVDGIQLHVLSIIGRRIKKIRVIKLEEQPAET